MKAIRIKNNLTVVLKDGSVLTSTDCTDALYNSVMSCKSDKKVRKLLMPEFYKKKKEINEKLDFVKKINKSAYLSYEGNSIYIRSISQLTVPEDLAQAIYKAEKKGREEELKSYLNFWTLASLNPDSRARMNLFWFLKRYGMTISSSGLFVAYRNVVLKKEGTKISSKLAKFITTEYARIKFKEKKDPSNCYVGKIGGIRACTSNINFLDKVKGNLAELYVQLADEELSPVYTDGYTGKFTIKIGEAVTMDRSKCDTNHDNTCSRGLHVAGRSWLQSGYFGDTSLMVLVNPADVVAVPPQDSYGKMRCCAYYPVKLVERNDEGKIINDSYDNGFEDDFIEAITFDGDISNEDVSNYKLTIPVIPELDTCSIRARLDDIREQLTSKTIENNDYEW